MTSPIDIADARVRALEAIAAIREQLRPLLEALAADRDGGVVATLRPHDDDAAKVFTADALATVRPHYAQLWRETPRLSAVPAPYELEIAIAPAGMLVDDNELSHAFPSGYRGIAAQLQPARTWVCWRYRSDVDGGLRYDGLVWCDDHWVWFPKPYQALRAARA